MLSGRQKEEREDRRIIRARKQHESSILKAFLAHNQVALVQIGIGGSGKQLQGGQAHFQPLKCHGLVLGHERCSASLDAGFSR